jgi:membrane protein implicated in regulation of membrane protease activity
MADERGDCIDLAESRFGYRYLAETRYEGISDFPAVFGPSKNASHVLAFFVYIAIHWKWARSPDRWKQKGKPMADWIVWFIAAGVVVIMEMFTGTFYLLMIAVGLAAGGLASLAGSSEAAQYLIAAIVGSGATYALRRSRLGRGDKVNAARDPNVNLDIGQALNIKEWKDTDSSTPSARVAYRGAMWDVELAHGSAAQPGVFTICEVRGSRLIVTDKRSKNY